MMPETEYSDQELVISAQKDPCVFNALYERYVQPVYRYHYRHVNNKTDAEDLTSQTFLAALEALPRFRPAGNFPGWLFTIAHNKVIDYYRRSPQTVQLVGPASASDPTDVHEKIELEERSHHLRQLINNLADDEKELINLRYIAGLSFIEIGVVMRKRADTVKKRHYRILERLRFQMEAQDE